MDSLTPSEGERVNVNKHGAKNVCDFSNYLEKRSFGFPDRLVTKLHYGDVFQFASTTGAVNATNWRMNGIFDPDKTGGGHQPQWRDTFALIYNHYSVISSQITIRTTLPTTAGMGAIQGLIMDDDGVTASTASAMMEHNRGLWDVVQPGGNGTSTITLGMNATAQLGVDPYSDQSYKTAMGSNPTEEVICTQWICALDLVSTATTSCVVEIEYLVQFSERITTSQS